jgi:hypothetical protein
MNLIDSFDVRSWHSSEVIINSPIVVFGSPEAGSSAQLR